MLPKYLETIGASKSYIGVFSNINSLELVLFVIFFGAVSTKINKKAALLWGMGLFLISSVLMFVFKNNLTILMLLRVVAAVSYGFGYTIHMNMIFDILPYSRRASGMALFGISGIMASPAGALVGEIIISHSNHAHLFLLSAIICLFTIFIIIPLRTPMGHSGSHVELSFGDFIKRKELHSLFYTSIIFGGTFAIFIAYIPIYTNYKLGVSNLSFFLIPYSIVAVIMRIFFSSMLDKVSKKKLFLTAILCMFISMTLIIFMNSLLFLVPVGLIYGVAHSILFPTLSTAFVNSGKIEERVALNNAFVASNAGGNIFITGILGFIGDNAGKSGFAVIFSLIALLILINFVILQKYKEHQLKESL